MNKYRYYFEQVKIARLLLYWTLLVIPVSLACGSLVALFLYLLDLATALRWQNQWLTFLLPLAGLLIFTIYKVYGKNSDAGNNLIIDEIHMPGGGIPIRMIPLVLFSTTITHLFGGSAGREGTAVQIGGSLAALFSRGYKLKHKEKGILLMCGMAAGFGAVFGTPIAGAIFALEVLSIGRIKYDALLPCFIASLLADLTCSAYGIHHVNYHALLSFNSKEPAHLYALDVWLLLKVIVAGICFGLTGYLFAEGTSMLKRGFNKIIKHKWLIPVCGGAFVILISYALGTFDYLGLGVDNPNGGVSIVSAFNEKGWSSWSWFWKLLLTAVTISAGFKGGEVTPLFFIGATLGNTLAMLSNSPTDLFAAIGFIAVFAGATNTPIASALMGVELFGSNNVIYYAVACFTAYYFSGHSGIYSAQRVAVSKLHLTNDEDRILKDNR